MIRPLRTAVAALCAIAPAFPAAAQQQTSAAPVLQLGDALALAGADQPRIEAYERDADAAKQAAIAARTLPDPQLMTGIENLPITGSNVLSPGKDMMTMLMVGIMREQVRRSKRDAAAEKILAEALVSRRQATATERQIRRDVMIAWIDAVEAREKQALLDRMIADLRAGRKVMAADIPTGGSTPALALQADAEIDIEQSELADVERAETHARAQLARWIGNAAYRPLPDSIPDIQVPLSVKPSIGSHPEMQVAVAQQQAAQREVAVANENRKPDLTWSVAVGFRPRYGEMLTGTVSIPLEVNRDDKQDRLVAEAADRANAAALRAEDTRRELTEDYRTAVADYEGADAELDRLNDDAIPALEAAFKTAEARYEGGGGGTLDQPFAIVRRYIEVHIQALEARGRRAHAAAEIIYVQGETQ